jgi:hypothetical protein
VVQYFPTAALACGALKTCAEPGRDVKTTPAAIRNRKLAIGLLKAYHVRNCHECLPARQRSAIEGMDENDLGTRLQRSSDQLRTGQFSDPAEAALTSDLQKLGHDVTDADRSLGSAEHIPSATLIRD